MKIRILSVNNKESSETKSLQFDLQIEEDDSCSFVPHDAKDESVYELEISSETNAKF